MNINNLCIILILFTASSVIIAQNELFKLHPTVGDTIDNSELNRYYLFNNHNLDSIKYLVIKEYPEYYILFGQLENNKTVKIQITGEEIMQNKQQIERLNLYTQHLSENDSLNLDSIFPNPHELNLHLNIQSAEFQKSLKKSIKHEYWNEYRRQSQERRQKGIMYY